MRRSNTNDDTFIEAPPDVVFDALTSLGRGASWWQDAAASATAGRLAVRAPGFHRLGGRVSFEARIEQVRPGEGLVWSLDRGELHGRAEWWLEPFKAGTIVHYLLDVHPGDAGRRRRLSSRVRRHRLALRRGVNALKDRSEGR